jgi:hypothetical protein
MLVSVLAAPLVFSHRWSLSSSQSSRCRFLYVITLCLPLQCSMRSHPNKPVSTNLIPSSHNPFPGSTLIHNPIFGSTLILGVVSLRQARSRESSGLMCSCPGMTQVTFTWLGAAPAPPDSLIIRWNLLGSSLPIG